MLIYNVYREKKSGYFSRYLCMEPHLSAVQSIRAPYVSKKKQLLTGSEKVFKKSLCRSSSLGIILLYMVKSS